MGLLPTRGGDVSFENQPLARVYHRRPRRPRPAPPARRRRRLPRPLHRGWAPPLSPRVSAALGPILGPSDVYALFPALGERRSTRAGSLSGGQQQMLALSLALLGTPRCLMLDEPSIGLAPNLVERLFAQVQDVCRAHAVSALLVEQNVAAALKIADRVVIMNNGAIVFDGTPDEARAADVWHYF